MTNLENIEELYAQLKLRHQLIRKLTYLQDARLMGWGDSLNETEINFTEFEIFECNQRIKELRHG